MARGTSFRMAAAAAVLALVGASAWAGPDSTCKNISNYAHKYLVFHQNQDGSYGAVSPESSGKTALVLYVLSSSERNYRYADGPFVSNAMDYLLQKQNDDGSWGEGAGQGWQTVLAVRALGVLQDKRTDEAVARGTEWLKQNNVALPEDEIGLFRVVSAGTGGGEYGTMLIATLEQIATKDAAAVEATIKKLAELQAGDDTKPEFGSFGPAQQKDTLESDPVVATALAVCIADRVKPAWKKISK